MPSTQNNNFIPYRLPLIEPIQLGSITTVERQGILLQAMDEGGVTTGWGDAAPLPPFSRETIKDVQNEIEHPPPYSSPSLRFAHWSAQQNIFSSALSLPLCALLQGDRKAVLEQTRTDLGNGFRTFKLKVGRGTVEDDIETVLQLLSLINHTARLRLDANRAWNYDTAVRFAQATRDSSIEFIEEPLQDWKRLPDWMATTDYPTALDESIRLILTEKELQPAALVIKPSWIGGHEEIQPFTEKALKHKIPLIFSSVYESGIGIRAIAHLASQISPCPSALGLDTYRWLKSDVLVKPLAFNNGRIYLEEISELSSIVNV